MKKLNLAKELFESLRNSMSPEEFDTLRQYAETTDTVLNQLVREFADSGVLRDHAKKLMTGQVKPDDENHADYLSALLLVRLGAMHMYQSLRARHGVGPEDYDQCAGLILMVLEGTDQGTRNALQDEVRRIGKLRRG